VVSYRALMQLPYRELRSARLRLRPPAAGDAAAVLEAWGADPEATRYLAWRPHTSLREAEEALAQRIQRLASGVEYSWLLESAGASGPIGVVSAWPTGTALELGFVLARRAWGNGLATESVRCVSEWALAAPQLTFLFATCDAENRASARVLEKSGFVCRGPYERAIVRPNLSAEPRPSLYFTRERGRGPG
jgi:ribosomal-protein-alanine N-acetyltransferase